MKSKSILIVLLLVVVIVGIVIIINKNNRDFQNNNLQIYSSNLNILLELFENYDGDNNEEIFNRINYIMIEKNIPLLYDYYGESADEIISNLKNIKGIEIKIKKEKEDYNSKHKTINDEIKSLENQLFLLDENIDDNIDYISIIVSRRFDTDPLSGKGVYEAADMDNYKKVVLIAGEDEIKNYQGYKKRYLVRDLGEMETVVSKSNAFRSWEEKEYYTYYITVPESENPYVIKEKLSALKNTREELEKDILVNENEIKNKYNPIIKSNINKIMDIIEKVGTLSLQITPSDAKLQINKRDYYHRSAIKLDPGTYKLEISKDGWYAQDEMVTLGLGETLSKSYTLQQKTGTLQFSVQPLDAKVELRDAGGKLYKSWTGMRLEKDVPVGSYELTCTYSSYKTEKRNISITENQTLPLKIQMEEGISYSSSQYGVEEILVPGGSFRMGDVWGGGYKYEKPVHTVMLSSFYIGKYEVKQALYQEIMGNNPSNFKGNNLPVERVTWYNAVDFCNKLSEKAGLQKVYTISGTNVRADFTKNGYRLPTEAEWEYAARSCGRDDRKWSGTNTESELGNYAWYDSNSGSKTHPVGTKQPNDLGIYDMSGNVWEWCWDCYEDYSSSSKSNPTGPSRGSDRVRRGGSWNSYANYCRTAYRGHSTPSSSHYSLGFRLANMFCAETVCPWMCGPSEKHPVACPRRNK